MNETNTSMAPEALQDETGFAYYLYIISVVIVVFGVISFEVMMRAPRIAPNIRYMCCNIIFYDICVIIAYAVHYSQMNYSNLCCFRLLQCSIMGQWFAVTGFSVERLIAIGSPYMYRRYFKKKNVKAFILVELFCFTGILVLTPFVNRNQQRAQLVCYGGMSLHTTFSVVCLVCSMKTLIIFRKSLLRSRAIVPGITNGIRQVSRSRDTISIVCILFVVLHIPTGIEIIIRKCNISNERLYSRYLIIFNSAIDPLLYVWKFRECRLQGLKCLSRFPCCGFLKNAVEARRIEIFNIPISEHAMARMQNAAMKRRCSQTIR